MKNSFVYDYGDVSARVRDLEAIAAGIGEPNLVDLDVFEADALRTHNPYLASRYDPDDRLHRRVAGTAVTRAVAAECAPGETVARLLPELLGRYGYDAFVVTETVPSYDAGGNHIVVFEPAAVVVAGFGPCYDEPGPVAI